VAEHSQSSGLIDSWNPLRFLSVPVVETRLGSSTRSLTARPTLSENLEPVQNRRQKGMPFEPNDIVVVNEIKDFNDVLLHAGPGRIAIEA
jgi:hypothetical protein